MRPQFHLDLQVDDLDAAAAYAQSIGARRAASGDHSPNFIVFSTRAAIHCLAISADGDGLRSAAARLSCRVRAGGDRDARITRQPTAGSPTAGARGSLGLPQATKEANLRTSVKCAH